MRRAGDRGGQRLLIDDRPARRVGFISARRSAFNEMMGLSGERAADRNKVRAMEHAVQRDQLHAEFCRRLRVRNYRDAIPIGSISNQLRASARRPPARK